jgi:hypothetical protein
MILTAARDLVEQGWTQRAFARDKDGYLLDLTQKEAVAYCAIGAFDRAAHDLSPEVVNAVWLFHKHCARYLLYEAVGASCQKDVTKWNDDADRQERDVLDAYDRAIELAVR